MVKRECEESEEENVDVLELEVQAELRECAGEKGKGVENDETRLVEVV